MKIHITDISEFKEFDRCGWHYTKVGQSGIYYLFKMEKKGINYKNFELWKGKKAKQPDGSVVFKKPSDEDFGTWGWYLCGNEIEGALERISQYNEDFDLDYFKRACGI